MNVQNKLAIFSRNAVAEAEKRAKEALCEINEKLTADEEAAVLKARMDAEWKLSATKRRCAEQNNRELLNASFEAKLAVFDTRNGLTAKLADAVHRELMRYAAADTAYLETLLNNIHAFAKAYSGCRIEVRLRPIDYARIKDRLTELADICEDESLVGGFTAIVRDRGVAADYSFARLLETAMTNFEGLRIDG